MERINLDRGRWLRFERPMYISDRRAIVNAAESSEGTTLLDMMAAMCAVIEPAIAERSWDGAFDQLTVDELNDVARQWSQQTEDDALPPADGTSSETTSPDSDS